MSACTCTLRADECTGSSGIYYPLQDGGQCAIQDCEKQVTTDNSAVLVNALAEIERLKEVINLQVENYAELKEQNEAQHGYFNSVMVENDQARKYAREIERKDAALRVALEALMHYQYGGSSYKEQADNAITTIKEALA